LCEFYIETEEKQALIDPTLERETYTTQQPLLLVQGTDFVASEDLKHGIIEYANENMINIGLRETPMGVSGLVCVYICVTAHVVVFLGSRKCSKSKNVSTGSTNGENKTCWIHETNACFS